MNSPAVSQQEYEALKKENDLLKKRLEAMNDKGFRDKLEWAYHLFHDSSSPRKLELRRGAGIGMITRVPDHFTDELTDFNALE